MSDFWGRLTVPEQAALATVASPSRFEADSTIIHEHDATDHVLVIRSGLAKVSARIGANRDVLLALRRPGDIIGEMAGVADGRLYLPNARFSTPVTPTTPYNVVALAVL